ncbi:MAG: hypothetical protein JNL34_17750 [Anaerolineae bacterium]|nr:hypothetical protein [Anaerolineae bacterium]
MGLVVEQGQIFRPNPRQRWGNIFTIAFSLLALALALQVKSATESATVIYSDPVAGITVQYPQGWLLDTSGEAVLKVSNESAEGYKTSIEVRVLPLSVGLTERNLVDNLILNRSQTLASFDVLERESLTLGEDERPATSMVFTFVASEVNPFLQSLPLVVEGMDVITAQGGQALIVTFLSDAATYDDNFETFQRFLNEIDF